MSSFTPLFPVSFSSHPLEPENENAPFFQKATDILFVKVLLRRLPSSKVVFVPCDVPSRLGRYVKSPLKVQRCSPRKETNFTCCFFSSPVDERQKRFFESTNFAALVENKSLL